MGAVCDRQDEGFDFSEMQDLAPFLLLNWLSTIFMFSHSSIWDWVVSLRSSLRLLDFESLFLELLGTTELVLWVRTSLLFCLLFMDLLKLEMAERETMVPVCGLPDLRVLSLRDLRLGGLASVSFWDYLMLFTCTLMQLPRVLIVDSLLSVWANILGCNR